MAILLILSGVVQGEVHSECGDLAGVGVWSYIEGDVAMGTLARAGILARLGLDGRRDCVCKTRCCVNEIEKLVDNVCVGRCFSARACIAGNSAQC